MVFRRTRTGSVTGPDPSPEPKPVPVSDGTPQATSKQHPVGWRTGPAANYGWTVRDLNRLYRALVSGRDDETGQGRQ